MMKKTALLLIYFGTLILWGCPCQDCDEFELVCIPTLVEDGTWELKASMYTARSYFETVMVDGKIYAIGGQTDEGATGIVEEYDPETDTWTMKSPMPTPRCIFAAVEVEGKIYCMGGREAIPHGATMSYNKVEVYDPSTDTWETKTNMPTRRANFHMSYLDGKIYLYGGYVGFTPSLKKVDVYDPAADTWSQAADMPEPKFGFSSLILEDKIVTFLGGMNSSTESLASNSICEYDPHTDQWTRDTLMIPHGNLWYTRAFEHEGNVYFLNGLEIDIEGGEYSVESAKNLYKYTPGENIVNETSMPLPYIGVGPSVLYSPDSVLYLMGGAPLLNNGNTNGDASASVYAMNLKASCEYVAL